MLYSQSVESRLEQWRQSAADLGRALNKDPDVEWPAARKIYLDTLARLFPAPANVLVSDLTMAGMPTSVIAPATLNGDRVMLYLHGGGYASGGRQAYHGLGGQFANLLNAEVYIPDYRLAPEHPFPAAIDDVLAAYLYLIDEGRDPASIVISGDSAGGAMVVTLMRKIRDLGLVQPAAGVAISPWANLEHTGRSACDREGRDPLCSAEFLGLLADNFLGHELPSHPDASPVFADVRNIAPVMIQIGENEVMMSDGIRLAGHLAEQRVRVSLEVWPEMFHVWHLFFQHLPQADQALENAAAFLLAALKERE